MSNLCGQWIGSYSFMFVVVFFVGYWLCWCQVCFWCNPVKRDLFFISVSGNGSSRENNCCLFPLGKGKLVRCVACNTGLRAAKNVLCGYAILLLAGTCSQLGWGSPGALCLTLLPSFSGRFQYGWNSQQLWVTVLNLVQVSVDFFVSVCMCRSYAQNKCISRSMGGTFPFMFSWICHLI